MTSQAAEYNGRSPADAIDDLLPQTQCQRCGYAGCRPYAQALAAGETDINRCPPGGEQTMEALAQLLARTPKSIDPECGTVEPGTVARIDENECIGCTKCIQACPVDAILGAAKQLHTVIEAECTGCELCIAPCPVDCIDMTPGKSGPWTHDKADHARTRYVARNQRLEGLARTRESQRRRKQQELSRSLHRQRTVEGRQAEIAASIERVKRKREMRRREQAQPTNFKPN